MSRQQVQFPPGITTLEDKRSWLRSRISGDIIAIKQDHKQFELILETTRQWATTSNVQLLRDIVEDIEYLSKRIQSYQAALRDLPKIPVPTRYLKAIEVLMEKCAIADNFHAARICDELDKWHRDLRENYDVHVSEYTSESIATKMNKFAQRIY